MKLRDIPEMLVFLPNDINLDADINEPIMTVDPSLPDQKLPILHWACKNNYTVLVEKLIANSEPYGLNINAPDTYDNNALYHTSRASITQLLVEAGIDLTARFTCALPTMGAEAIVTVLPLDLFLPPINRASFLLMVSNYNPLGMLPESKQTKEVLATVYDGYFYEKNKTKLAIALDESAVGSLASFATPLIAEYASILHLMTDRKEMDELGRLVSTCQAAHSECLVESSIRKLLALADQSSSSTSPTQQRTPALGFSNSSICLGLSTIPNVTTTTSSGSSASSNSSSSSQKPKLKEHPCQKRRPGT